MTKKTKIIIKLNLIFWIIAALLIFLGFIFIFSLSKGIQGGTNNQNLEKIVHIGTGVCAGILIAVSVGIVIVAIVTLFSNVRKEISNNQRLIAFISSIISTLIIIMSILDVASLWRIWPWLFNAIFIIGFAFWYSWNWAKKYKKHANSHISKLKVIGELHDKNILTFEEYEDIKRRVITEHNKLYITKTIERLIKKDPKEKEAQGKSWRKKPKEKKPRKKIRKTKN